jgi:biopolymer transport protein ExbB/TolQ
MDNLIAQIRWEELSQTYFTRYFVAGGPKVWFILLPMSMAALYLIIDISLAVRRRKLFPAAICSDIHSAAIRSGVLTIPGQFAKRTDLVSRAICAVYGRSRGIQPSLARMKEIAAENLQEQGLKLLRKAELCNLMGNISPMVGLFGTVYGMIEAFNQMGISQGQPKAGELAYGISVALVSTYWGLLVAIPSLFFSGIFKVKIEGLVAGAAIEVETLLEQLSELKPAVTSGNIVTNEKPQIRSIKDTGGKNEPSLKPRVEVIPSSITSRSGPVAPKQQEPIRVK